MMKRAFQALGALAVVGMIFLYFWVFLGLGHQLGRIEYRIALGLIGLSALPIAYGILSQSRRHLLLGLALGTVGVAGILIRHGFERSAQAARDMEQRGREHAALQGQAREVLECRDGSRAVLHSVQDPRANREILALSLLDAKAERMPEILCVWRKGEAPLCRGLERKVQESGLQCANGAFRDLQEMKARFFTP